MDLLATVAALRLYNRLGHPVELGTGVKVAQEYILKNQSDIAVEEGVIK